MPARCKTEQGLNVRSQTPDSYSISSGTLFPSSLRAPDGPVQGRARIASNREFRILLIDDNRDATESMGALLELLDYDVRTADDAESGLAMAIAFQPHLIFSDIGLPGMDGYQLAPELRKAAGERKLVLAAATGYGLPSDRARAMRAGFDYHLVKPIDADMLLNFVARQLLEY
jgi:CheY-like chemotaxis protein